MVGIEACITFMALTHFWGGAPDLGARSFWDGPLYYLRQRACATVWREDHGARYER